MAKLSRVVRTPKPGAKVRTWFSTNLEASAAYRKAKKSGGPINKDLKHDSDMATLKVAAAIVGPAIVGAGVIVGASIDGVNDSNTAKNLGIETGVAMAREDAKSETGFQEITEDKISTDVEGLPGAFKDTYKSAGVEAYKGYIEGYNRKTGQEDHEASSTLSLVSDGNSAEGETTTTEKNLEAMKAELKEKGRTDAYISGFDAGYSDTASQSESQTPEGTLEEQLESEQTFDEISNFMKSGDKNSSLANIVKAIRGLESRITMVDEVIYIDYENDVDASGNAKADSGHINMYVKASNENGQTFVSCVSVPVNATSYTEALSSFKSNLTTQKLDPQIFTNIKLIDKDAPETISVNGQSVSTNDIYAQVKIKGVASGKYNSTVTMLADTESGIAINTKETSGLPKKPSEEEVVRNAIGYIPVVEEEMQ